MSPVFLCRPESLQMHLRGEIGNGYWDMGTPQRD